MRIRLDLEDDAAVALVNSAVAERRPVAMQAEALLRKALGLPVAPEPRAPVENPQGKGEDHAVRS